METDEEKESNQAPLVRCLIIDENKDLIKYGISGNSLVFHFKRETYNKIDDFRYLRDFVIHLYKGDTFVPDVILGIDRYDKCHITSFDDNTFVVRFNAHNKKFYNHSETRFLRKDKIGNFVLGEQLPDESSDDSGDI